MRLAFIIFDDITWLDLIGIYDSVRRLKSLNYLPDLTWDFCAFLKTANDFSGIEVKATKIKTSLADYDALIVSGGHGTRQLQFDTEFINWIQTAQNVPLKISVCTGSIILGAAGFLKDKKATTHYLEYEALKPYCAKVLTDRIVVDGNVITAGAVSSSLDLGLYLCDRWAGAEAAAEIRKRMAYRG